MNRTTWLGFASAALGVVLVAIGIMDESAVLAAFGGAMVGREATEWVYRGRAK